MRFDEEKGRLKAAQDAWTSGKYTEFSEFAKEYSEDSGSSNGGKFGYIDTTTSNVDEVFVKAATSLKEGEVSDWTYSETFGYYLIKCDTTNVEDFKEEPSFVDAILAQNENLSKTIFWDAVTSLNVTFNDPELVQQVNEAYNPASQTEDDSEGK